jgi:long-subunit acyl-CoA synthetase (AMP-forming)
LLPLAVLLENIAGVYAPLLAGGRCVLPSLKDVGLIGASKFDVNKMFSAIERYRATTVILLPQMLHACVDALRNGAPLPSSLRFVAVGGAPVSPVLLAQGRQLGLPVYEGYGLSECASVVAVSSVNACKPGSVGKLLPHVKVKFEKDGEILLSGNLYSGYLNQGKFADEWYPSGDIGYRDDEGYLFLTGRKKNCFITSYGRNVAPEWVERELKLSPAIEQVVVFGEARPFNVAVIVASYGFGELDVKKAIKEINHTLPDYAQVTDWVFADEPFSLSNEEMTATGRPRRNIIRQHYEQEINQLYNNVGHDPERNRHGVL